MECIGKNVTVHMMDVMEQIQSCKLVFDKSVKVPILKEVTSEKCNSIELNTFSKYLSSLLGVIANVFSNHAQK